jgi:hypothetical protein
MDSLNGLVPAFQSLLDNFLFRIVGEVCGQLSIFAAGYMNATEQSRRPESYSP